MTGSLLTRSLLGSGGTLLRRAVPALSTLLPQMLTNSRGLIRGKSTFGEPTRKAALYLTDCEEGRQQHASDAGPVTLGLINYFERHLPFVGFFQSIGGTGNLDSNHPLDRHARLIRDVFQFTEDPRQMMGATEEEAARLIASGKTSDLLDKIYAQFASYRSGHDLVVVEGPSLAGGDVDAQIAAALSTPVLLSLKAGPTQTADDIFNSAMYKRELFRDHKVDVLGVILNKVPAQSHALITARLKRKFDDAGLVFAGCLPEDPLLQAVRLDEVQDALKAEVILGSSMQLDQEYDSVIVASQRVEELLEMLEEQPHKRPLVVSSVDRLDVVLGLLAAQVSVQGPSVAGMLLTPAGRMRSTRSYARSTAERIFEGIQRGGLYQGALLPVMTTDLPMYDVVRLLDHLRGSILPSSAKKISHCKAMFDKYVDTNVLAAGLTKYLEETELSKRVTPKMFLHNIKELCRKHPQTIVLPESTDKRVLTAACEVVTRGLAKVILLGNPDLVQAEAKKLGLDIGGCMIEDPKTSPRLEKYVEALVEARKSKGLSRESAMDQVLNDINTFGVMMVRCGDADGMVSGAIHTTAATIRPAMQVLKTPNLVSSVFFMCLPDKVLVYGDCAVNVNPSSQDLAQIAVVSAHTAQAFGIEPRVAMLSYSTMGSGAGPDVQKVTEAVKLVKEQHPELKLEGPLQYDAAIDPAVAALKIKTPSEVAGKATVFIFPDLNTGNNTYKAVQQASGGIAMGPIMQGLAKPVNDLSRGCTIQDILNTVCMTSVQAMQAKGVQ